jgi:hypothetical protein
LCSILNSEFRIQSGSYFSANLLPRGPPRRGERSIVTLDLLAVGLGHGFVTTGVQTLAILTIAEPLGQIGLDLFDGDQQMLSQ